MPHLSDHAHQTMQFSKVTPDRTKKLFTLTVSTVNLLNWGFSKESHGEFKNNPWNIEETFAEYFNRKKQQLDQILKILQGDQGMMSGLSTWWSGQAPDPAKDAMFLQEIDIFLNKRLGSAEATNKLNALKSEFFQKLKNIGYDMVITRPIPGCKQQPLAILYNTKTLKFTGQARGILDYNNDHDFRGFECLFERLVDNKPTKDIVALASVHLKYGPNYSQIIPEYQRKQVENNIFTIMGGDTNHAPNIDIVGSIACYNTVTTIEGDEQGNESGLHQNTDRAKCYDVFFMNPDKAHRAHALEIEAEEFVKNNNSNKYQLVRQNFAERRKNNPDTLQHLSPVGQPWAKGAQPKIQQNGGAPAQPSPQPVPAAAGPVQTPAAAGLVQNSAIFSQPKTIDITVQDNSLVINFNNERVRRRFCHSLICTLKDCPADKAILQIPLQGNEDINVQTVNTQQGVQLTFHFETETTVDCFCHYLGLSRSTAKKNGPNDWAVTFTVPPLGLHNTIVSTSAATSPAASAPQVEPPRP